MKKLLFTVLMLATAPVWAKASFVGKYNCEGKDPFAGDAAYTQVLTISKTHGIYILEWTSGDQVYQGTGIPSNDDKQLIASFQDRKDPTQDGTIMYNITPAGELHGFWTYVERDQIAKESCKRAS